MELVEPQIASSAFIAPGAVLVGDVSVGERAVVMFGVVGRAELDRIVIGAETNLQDNTVVHVDAGFPALIGNRVTVGHAAVVHGATVGDGALIGIRAVVLNGSEVGEGAWVAAGSVLAPGKTVPPFTLAVGTPAKPIRDLTEDEIRSAAAGVDNYLEFGTLYRHRFAGA